MQPGEPTCGISPAGAENSPPQLMCLEACGKSARSMCGSARGRWARALLLSQQKVYIMVSQACRGGNADPLSSDPRGCSEWIQDRTWYEEVGLTCGDLGSRSLRD